MGVIDLPFGQTDVVEGDLREEISPEATVGVLLERLN